MTTVKIRLMFWSGCLGAVILFSGDMLFYGFWGSGRSLSPDRIDSEMASVALWRLHLGSITGPVGLGLELLGILGLWHCCKRSAPRLAGTMLATLCTGSLFGILQHGIFGPLGFSLRYCGRSSGAVTQILKLNDILSMVCISTIGIGSLVWVFLTLKKKTGVPRWAALFCPFIILWFQGVLVYVPAPIGLPLLGGATNIATAMWFAILAVVYSSGDPDLRSCHQLVENLA